jgi:putative membrane protein
MLWLKRIVLILLLVAVAVASVIFVLENQSPVQLSFAGNLSPEWPLAAYITLAFIAGGLLGLLAGQALRLRLHMKVARTASQLKRSRRELAQSADSSASS